MTRKEAVNENLRHLISEYRKGNWAAELVASLTEGDSYMVRNQAHRFVTNPSHPESILLAIRFRDFARKEQ